ncbi:MAG TPA: hypothetical protein VFS21_30255 [Roseiflexaceae bacterium]|nr:hypothetical protein [Roseiflexaceae bacterium]
MQGTHAGPDAGHASSPAAPHPTARQRGYPADNTYSNTPQLTPQNAALTRCCRVDPLHAAPRRPIRPQLATHTRAALPPRSDVRRWPALLYAAVGVQPGGGRAGRAGPSLRLSGRCRVGCRPGGGQVQHGGVDRRAGRADPGRGAATRSA